jgi:hypothetical protein
MRFGKDKPKTAKQIQKIRNARACGSNPVRGSKKINGFPKSFREARFLCFKILLDLELL